MHVLADRRMRPARPCPDAHWGRLHPLAGRQWVDLLDDQAPDGIRVLYALLDAGLMEAWQDVHGHVRLKATGPRFGAT